MEPLTPRPPRLRSRFRARHPVTGVGTVHHAPAAGGRANAGFRCVQRLTTGVTRFTEPPYPLGIAAECRNEGMASRKPLSPISVRIHTHGFEVTEGQGGCARKCPQMNEADRREGSLATHSTPSDQAARRSAMPSTAEVDPAPLWGSTRPHQPPLTTGSFASHLAMLTPLATSR
jgi:hypothetical protein